MNIRTVLSLSGPQAMEDRYERQVDEVTNTVTKSALISGLMFGLSSLVQFATFALIFFLSAVYVNQFNLNA